MIKKLATTIFMLTCILCASASAQTQTSAEKQAAIKELVSLVNGNNKMEEVMSAMVPQMQAQQDATMKASLDQVKDLTAAEKQTLADSYANDRKYSVKRLMDKMLEKLDYNAMVNEIASTLFDKYYSLEEIRDLSAFYKRLTGQKSLKMITPMMTDTMLAMQERVMPKMMLVIQEIMNEDKAEIEQKINAGKATVKKTGAK